MKAISGIQYAMPNADDGVNVWGLISEAGKLDLNSSYCYMMLCDYFKETCVIAKDEDEVVGFLSALCTPRDEKTLFVWQIAVSGKHRRKGIGRKMLDTLLNRESCRDIRYIETTISPDNLASRRMFAGLAAERLAPCTISSGYKKEMFPEDSQHEPEQLFRIGPLKQ